MLSIGVALCLPFAATRSKWANIKIIFKKYKTGTVDTGKHCYFLISLLCFSLS